MYIFQMGILVGDFCRVMWDSTGIRQNYPTGFRDEYELVLHEVNEDGIEVGRQPTMAQIMQAKKAQMQKEKQDRFDALYGTNIRATMDGLRGVKHLIGLDAFQTSKRSKMQPIDYLKMCFAVPMMKQKVEPIPTPLLQDPFADPYTHAGSPRPSFESPTKMGIRTPSVAIIGAGVAAAVLARRLALLHYKITCFEKRDCQGGRLGNVRRGEEMLSLGCPYFQASSASFVKEVEDWVEKGLVVPFDMNVGVLHGQCLGEYSHFDSVVPDPELYEKTKQMHGIINAKRNVADGSGDVFGCRFGRFTTCRIWYDCASEQWALEQKHSAIAKEVSACEAARDRAISDIRRVEYLLDKMQTGFMDLKANSNLLFCQGRDKWKKTLRQLILLKEEIELRRQDEEELAAYLDPKERDIARRRLTEKRAKDRLKLEKELGMHLPHVNDAASPQGANGRGVDAGPEDPGGDADSPGDLKIQMLKRRKGIDEGNQPGIRRVAKEATSLQSDQEGEGDVQTGNFMTYDELLDTFIPDVDVCKQWTLNQDLTFMRTDWVLTLRDLSDAHAGVGKAEEELNKELAKLESAVQAIEHLKTYAAAPGPEQVVDVVIDLTYNKDLNFADEITLYLPHFKLNDHHNVRKKSVEMSGESSSTFKKVTFFAKTHELKFKHESRMVFNAGTPIRLRVPRLVSIPKRGVSLEHSYGFTAQAQASAGSSMVHALATALVDKPTHAQLRRRVIEADSEMDRIRASIMQGDTKAEAEEARHPWATCMYDDEFSLMDALAPDEGLPRHRTAHVHNFNGGLGPNQLMYMPTARSAKIMEVLAPGVKYLYNHTVVTILQAEGKHRVVAQKDEMDLTHDSQSETQVWRRGNTAGSSRGETAGSDHSNLTGSRQGTGILRRQPSPSRMSTAAARKRLRSMGDFDIVLVCTPPAVAASLTAQISPAISAACRNAQLMPCWVAYAKIEPVLTVANDAFATIKDPQNILVWATRETSRAQKAAKGLKPFDEWRNMKMLLKAGRPSTAVADARDKEDSWILHASAEFSQSHINTPSEDVAEILIERFVEMLDLGMEMDIIDSCAYLWEEGMYADFGPYVSDELKEAKTFHGNFMQVDHLSH